MMNEEMILKAKEARSAQELHALAKQNGIEMTEESAEAYYQQLRKIGEISDDELDNVAGGWCYHDGNRVVTAITPACTDWVCDKCGAKSKLNNEGKRYCSNMFEHEEKFIFQCYCSNCKYYKYEDALSLCTYHHG